MSKPGRNEPCPCGSGKKFKKCCLLAGPASGPAPDRASYTGAERLSALARLERFIEDRLGPEDDTALEAFWGRYLDHPAEPDETTRRLSDDAFDMWFAFDFTLDDGRLVVDRFLQEHPGLSTGERAYLRTLAGTAMHIYEVVDALPGVSLTLRDVLEGDQVTVRERLGSRTLNRFDWIAARIVPRGASGQPEIEAGLLPLPPLLHGPVRSQLSCLREAFLRERPGAGVGAFYKETAPFFHDAWIGAILEPFVPDLRNTDGEPMVVTRVLFDVLDAPALVRSLDGQERIERVGESEYAWSGTNARNEPVSLGRLEHRDGGLVLETNSVERGERGRAMIESIVGSAIRHRATSHEDLARRVRESLRPGVREDKSERSGAEALPPGVAEALTLNYYARYYRAWLDESIPALDGRTPREAARDSAVRPRLAELICGLEGMYQRALKDGHPAYDPSWMWSDLGFEEHAAPTHPPPLAHERAAEMVPGSGELSRRVAEQVRRDPGFEDAITVLREEGFRANLDLQRFLREWEARHRPVNAPADRPPALSPFLRVMVNFELHRRKTFWVDESLAYMLDHTDLDVAGRELRAPFPSCALVFTDRHVLSLAERMLAGDRTCPLSGQLLRVATVYVTEERLGDMRTLEICFALDALGADLPHLVRHTMALEEDSPVETYLDAVASRITVEPAIPDSHPLRGLIRVTINAILYATSAGVDQQVRPAPRHHVKGPRHRPGAPLTYSSEEVYFLPGAIEISKVRRMQELERVPDGRTILRRFMVRGHWRRAAAHWTDRHMRWIQPYWKGPDMATIIERTYKLKP